MLCQPIELPDNCKPRLSYLTTDLSYGGAETQLMQLAIRMKMLGWDVRVVSMLSSCVYVDKLNGAGIQVDTLGMTRGVPDPRACFRLATLLRKHPPQVLHAHMYHANVLARLTRLLAPIPALICTAHNTYESSTRTTQIREVTARERAYRLTDPLCDVTTQVSRVGLERYVRVKAVPASKIIYVPVGVDIDQFKPDAAVRKEMREALGVTNWFVWLAVGRLEEAKDYSSLLQAVSKLNDADICVLIAGQGSLKGSLETLARALGLQDRVRFLGLRTDIPALMQAADAFVLSSFYEGLPTVLLEAAASSLPVVATAVGGNSEVVIAGDTGYLVPPRNPAALADAMQRLMDLSPADRSWMGEKGRKWVTQNFSLDRIVERWDGIYRELMMKRSGGRTQ